MKTERTAEFINTETVISFAEYLLILCRTIEAIEQEEQAEQPVEFIVA